MGDRKFIQGLHRRGDAAKIRETVAQQMKESSIQSRPKPVDPIDYETYVIKNKVLLHNDPHRELLTFPHDDIQSPGPTPSKKTRTVHSTVPHLPQEKSGNLLVDECLHTYTDTCHLIKFKYCRYSGAYQQLPNIKKPTSLPDQVFEIDTEDSERDFDDNISRTSSQASMIQMITKTGWLYKGPDSGKENIISFTRQFKRRYFCIKQASDQTFSLEFFKDERKHEQKGVIFLDCAQEVVKNSKKGKYCFEVKTPDKVYLFAAESEAEMEDWIKTLDKVRTAAETLSQVSIDRARDEVYSPERVDAIPENSVHPELMKYSKESESMVQKARQEGRQNLFNIYSSMSRYIEDDEDEDDGVTEIDVFPRQFGERFMLRLLEFKMKLQVNLGDEGLAHKQCNPEPFFLTFSLYDAKEGRKISEDFHMDLNESETENMIPADLISASDRLHTVGDKTTAPDLMGLQEKWLLQKNKQGIFSVIRRHSEIYVYVKIEKVLQGPISQAVEPYVRGGDPKTASKQYKQMKQFCANIGHHRMPFAWSARPLATSSHGPCELPIYKQESSKMSEDEIIKHLHDLRRPEKQGKWQTIPGVFKISLHSIKAEQPLENTVTSSYVPVRPFPDPPTNPPAVEIEEFIPEKGQLSEPYTTYTNTLYVYPTSLKFDSQKSFTKARNIACCVELRDSDEDGAVPLKRVYARGGPSVFTTVASSTVLHHTQAPEYLEEVKICLPPLLHEKHHVLFRFYHVSCEGSKSGSSKRKDGLEMAVGYAWVPLLHSSGRVDVGEKAVGVAANLPARYLAHDTHSGRVSSSVEIKMVEGGKPLFKCKVHLNSTIYTKDQHLHTFFFNCQKMFGSPTTGSETENLNKLKVFEKLSSVSNTVEAQYIMNAVKSLHAVDVSTYIQFLPTLLNQLFKLITTTHSEDISMNAVRVIIHVVSEVQEAEKLELLEKYVKYIFRAGPIPRGSKAHTVHEELAKSLNLILRPTNADPLVVTRFLNNSWFFFEVLIKSMTQYLIDGERVKMPRNERFSSDYQYKIQTLLQTITPYIVSKYKEAPRETRNANFSLAYFIKMSFTLMDRGVVFQMISHHLHNFAVVEHKTLHEFKFEFLRIVSSHEHYIPLSLPLMRKGLIKSYKDIKLEEMELRLEHGKPDGPERLQDKHTEFMFTYLKSDYTLSEEYRRTHYLPGLLLQELKNALHEPKEIRRCAINVLRDQFAKHAFDDRYIHKSLQGRIAALYLPLIQILLENKHRLIKSDEKSPAHAPAPPPVANGDVGSSSGGKQDKSSAGHTPLQKHKSLAPSTGGPDGPKRDSSVFDMIAGTKIPYGKGRIRHTHLGLEELKTHATGSSSSLASSASSTDTKTDTSKEKADKGHIRQSSASIALAAASGAPGGTTTSPKLYQYQKLDVMEIKDLLVCFLHILKYLPDDILLGWFNNSSEYDIVDFFSLLEVCLDHFKYQGRRKIVTLSVIGDSSMGRKTTTLPQQRRSAAVPMPNGSLPHAMRSISQYGDYQPEPAFHATTSSEADAMMRALSEANMATETGMIILDVLSVYTEKFKIELAHREGDNTLMMTVFDLYLSFFKTSQSEMLQKHMFAVWRAFIRKIELAHREGDNTLMMTVFDLYLSFFKTSQSEMLQKHMFAVWRAFIRKIELAHREGDNTLMMTVFDLYLSFFKTSQSEMLQKHMFAVWRAFIRKIELAHREGDNTLMMTVFDLYLSFFKTSQSEMLQKHMFAVWRAFIRKFPTALFKGDASMCGKLCYELLKCCNSRLKYTRKEACILLYQLMKANFEFNKKKTFTRVHLQVIISVAQLIGNVWTLSNYRFQESLALINSYATADKSMNKTKFHHEVKDLTKRIKTVMMATAQMKEHERDPEMLVDLQYSLAKSYASTPELRKTWLESMARIHTNHSNHSEAGHCYIHIAALVAEYLKKRGSFPQGCAAFKPISPNIDKEESGIKDDSGMQDVQYTEETLVGYMELAAECLGKAERYEVLGDVYKLVIPMYERAREFEKLAQCYQDLSEAYTKVVDVMQSGRRLLGTYFRIGFFGQSYFDDEDQKVYIYKEPKVTNLSEVCERLKTLYEVKFGKDNVKLIMDSKTVDPSTLDNKYAYIQVTHVTPFFREKELQKRLTDFERNNNVNTFMYETPFTQAGKARGDIHEQYKRRTVLMTIHSFPFVKKRIEVLTKTECTLSPLEVAIDEMNAKVVDLREVVDLAMPDMKKLQLKLQGSVSAQVVIDEMNAKVVDLREVVDLAMPDMKKLQLKLQGSVSAQVNSGPLAYAETFLAEEKVHKYPTERVEALKNVFRDFISVCNDSLDLNAKLITTEQKEYHESLKAGFNEIVSRLSKLFGETILTKDSDASQRGSMSVFNLVTTTGSSNA